MSRNASHLRRRGFGPRVVGVLTCATILAACSRGPSVAPGSTSSSPTSSASRVVPTTTTTTVPIPSALQPSADQAANALVSDWAAGNRTAALTVATAPAVAALFAVPYPPGNAVDRGCATAFAPATCTFGPPGGGNPNLPIYSLTLATAPNGGWYVNAVQIDG